MSMAIEIVAENVVSVVFPSFPTPYGFDAEDRKVIEFIQRIKILQRQPRTYSKAFSVLYENSICMINYFVYLKRKITFYKWEIVLAVTNGSCHEYLCDLAFYDEGIILQINCEIIKKYLVVELTYPLNDIRAYDDVQRVLYSKKLIQEFQKGWQQLRNPIVL